MKRICKILFLALLGAIVLATGGCIREERTSCPTPPCYLAVVVDPLRKASVEVAPSLTKSGDQVCPIEDLTLHIFGRDGLVQRVEIAASELVPWHDGLYITATPVSLNIERAEPVEIVAWGNTLDNRIEVSSGNAGTAREQMNVALSGTQIHRQTSTDLFYGATDIVVRNIHERNFYDRPDTLRMARSASSVVVTAYGLDSYFGSGEYTFDLSGTHSGLDFYNRLCLPAQIDYRLTSHVYQPAGSRHGATTGICCVMPVPEKNDLRLDINRNSTTVESLRIDCSKVDGQCLLAPNRTLSIVIDADATGGTHLTVDLTVADWGDAVYQMIDWN